MSIRVVALGNISKTERIDFGSFGNMNTFENWESSEHGCASGLSVFLRTSSHHTERESPKMRMYNNYNNNSNIWPETTSYLSLMDSHFKWLYILTCTILSWCIKMDSSRYHVLYQMVPCQLADYNKLSNFLRSACLCYLYSWARLTGCIIVRCREYAFKIYF